VAEDVKGREWGKGGNRVLGGEANQSRVELLQPHPSMGEGKGVEMDGKLVSGGGTALFGGNG